MRLKESFSVPFNFDLEYKPELNKQDKTRLEYIIMYLSGFIDGMKTLLKGCA